MSSSSSVSLSSSSLSSSPSSSAPPEIKISAIDARISQMSDILNNSPTNIHARVVRGCLYATQNRWAEALVDLNQAIATEPRSKNTLLAYQKRGLYYYNNGLIDRAHADINIAKQLADSSDNVSQKTRADIDLLSGEIYKKRTMTLPLRSMSSGGVGRGGVGDGRAYREMTANQEQLQEDPPLAVAMKFRERFNNNIDEFLAHCLDGMEISQHDHAKRFMRAKAMLADDSRSYEALAELDAIIEFIPAEVRQINPDLFFVRAMACYKTEKIDRAIDDILMAIKIAPHSAYYFIIYSQLILVKGDVPWALCTLRAAWDADQKEFQQYKHLVLKEHLDVIERYSRLHVENTLESAGLCFVLGRCDLAFQKYSFARDHFPAESPEYLKAIIGLMKCNFEEGDYEAVTRYYQMALRLDPENPEVKFISEHFAIESSSSADEMSLRGPNTTPS